MQTFIHHYNYTQDLNSPISVSGQELEFIQTEEDPKSQDLKVTQKSSTFTRLLLPGVYGLDHVWPQLPGSLVFCHSRIFTPSWTLTLVLMKPLNCSPQSNIMLQSKIGSLANFSDPPPQFFWPITPTNSQTTLKSKHFSPDTVNSKISNSITPASAYYATLRNKLVLMNDSTWN